MERLKRLKQFLVEVWSELKKTTWPGRTEVYGTDGGGDRHGADLRDCISGWWT